MDKCQGKGCDKHNMKTYWFFDETDHYKKLTKTHKQTRCKVCGLFTVWVKK